MTAAEHPRLGIPLTLIVIDVLGATAAGLGIYGLTADTPPAFAPALGEPAKAWLLVALGAAMMGYAVVEILRRAAKSARQR